MLNSGDVVDLDLGVPTGREAGFVHPVVVITAQWVLRKNPSVVQVIPCTSTLRGYLMEVTIQPDPHNGLDLPTAAQCQHLRSVSASRITNVRGNVGGVTLRQIRETIDLLMDITS